MSKNNRGGTFTTGGLKTSGIYKPITNRRPPTATPESYPPYKKVFQAQLLFDPRFVQHDGDKQQEILDWIEQEFFIWLNDIRSRRIRTEHSQKREMFLTIAKRILDKYDSELSSDSDASSAFDGGEPQTFAGPAQLPPLKCAQYFETTMSEIAELSAACAHVLGGAAYAPASGEFFAWEVEEQSTDPKDLSE